MKGQKDLSENLTKTMTLTDAGHKLIICKDNFSFTSKIHILYEQAHKCDFDFIIQTLYTATLIASV